MSQENVEAFKHAGWTPSIAETSRHCWRDSTPRWSGTPACWFSFEGEARVYRGHERVRQMVGDLFEALAEFHVRYSEIRDLGDRIVAIGRVRTRGAESKPRHLSRP